MPEQLRCPQGHEWEGAAPPGGEPHLAVPCPICGVPAATKPSYLLDGLESTDSIINTPVRNDVRLSSKPTRVASESVPDSPRHSGSLLASTELELPDIKGYSIIRELGRGGMGVVYLADQEGLDRFVALKMIIPREDSGPEDLIRFKQEAAALSRMQHPNLVYVYEVGEHAGQPFIALEFVDGGDLDDKLAGKPQPPFEAAKLAETLARAMHAAHQKGIVHRDLKPGNVLLTSEGTPKITDFGLVRRQDSGGKPQTQTGIIMGTPNYMAPEQASGSNELIGPKTDVYALGAMLYEFLTGRPPFMADDGWDTILQVVSDEPVPPSHLNHKVPWDLETICLKCLEKEPDRRYESAEALAEDLGRFQRNEPIRARPVGPHERLWKWMKRRPAVAALLGTTMAALVGLLWLSGAYYLQLHKFAEINRRSVVRLSVNSGVQQLDSGDWFGALLWFAEGLDKDSHDPRRSAVHRQRIASVLQDCPQLVQILFHGGPIRFAAFSRDARRVVTASADNTAQVWDLETGQPRGTPLQHDGIVFQASFSPDDRTVLTASNDGTARVWDAETGQARFQPLPHGKAVSSASFSPNGQRIITTGGTDEALLWNAADGKQVARGLRHEGRIVFACFSPDGRWIATGAEDGTAQIWDAMTASRVATVRHTGSITYIAFNPGDRTDTLATTSTDGTARLWKVPAGEPLTPPLTHGETVNSAVFSPSGAQILTTSSDDTAKLWDARTGQLLVPPLRHGSDVRPYASFSPDGRWIATGSDDNTARVWSTATGAPALTRLVHNGTVWGTAFSPDGLLLATASDDRTVRIWNLASLEKVHAMPPAAPSPSAKQLSTPVSFSGPASPGLRGVRLEGNRVEGTNPVSGAAFQLTLQHADVKEPASLRVLYADISPDGRSLVTIHEDQTVCVWDARTGEPKTPLLRHTGVVTSSRVSARGDRLVTTSTDNTARLWSIPGGRSVTPPLRHRGTVRDAAFSPDGGKIVTASQDHTARVWDAFTGEPITPAIVHPHSVEAALFSSDGNRVTTRAADGSERNWTLATDTRSPQELRKLAEVLAGKRITDGVCWPLEPETLRAAWDEVRAQNPEAVGSWKRGR